MQHGAAEQCWRECRDAAQPDLEQAVVHLHRRHCLGPQRRPTRRDVVDPERHRQRAVGVAAGLQREAALEGKRRRDRWLRDDRRRRKDRQDQESKGPHRRTKVLERARECARTSGRRTERSLQHCRGFARHPQRRP
jgi:hypothetical protein